MIVNTGQGDQDLDQEVVDLDQGHGTDTQETEDLEKEVKGQDHVKDGKDQEIEGRLVILEVEGHQKGREDIGQGLEADGLDQMIEILIDMAEGGQGHGLGADGNHHPHLGPVQNLQEILGQSQG